MFPEESRPVEFATWQRNGAAFSALLLGVIYLVSGGWKVLSPFTTGDLLEMVRVPAGLGAWGATGLGAIELLAAFLLFLPRFRRWGGWLGGAMLVFFMAWIGFYYRELVGQDCSCFPILRRTVGPGFFVGDTVLLLLAMMAAVWSPPVRSIRAPRAALAAISLVALGSYGTNAVRQSGVRAPSPILVDGTPQSITNGNVLLFFYNPECGHCDTAARFLSGFRWRDARVIAIPTQEPQFAASFLRDTHLKAGTSLEVEKLRRTFSFVDTPFAVALVDGRPRTTFGPAELTPPSPEKELRKLGFIQ